MSRCFLGQWIAVAGVVVLITAVASAQQPGQPRDGAVFTGPPSMGKVGLVRNPRVQAELKLDDDQKAKVGEIATRLGEARGEQVTDRQQLRERREAFAAKVAEEEKKLDEFLNEAQQKRLSELSLQAEGIRALFRDDFADKLGLSDEQREKLQAILSEQREQARRERAQRGEGRQRGDFAAIRERARERERQVMEVFSEEQKKKWEELKGEPFQMSGRRGDGAGGERRRPRN